MIYYTIDKNIAGEKIIQDIQKLINTKRGDGNSWVLVISLQKINNYAGDNPVPKIEYHG